MAISDQCQIIISWSSYLVTYLLQITQNKKTINDHHFNYLKVVNLKGFTRNICLEFSKSWRDSTTFPYRWLHIFMIAMNEKKRRAEAFRSPKTLKRPLLFEQEWDRLAKAGGKKIFAIQSLEISSRILTKSSCFMMAYKFRRNIPSLLEELENRVFKFIK